jgi:hypothetical protein
MRTIAVMCGLLALAPGCSEPTPATFGADFEASMCRWATRCNVFVDERQCREALVWEDLGRYDYLTQAVADGRARFDGDAAGRCLNAIEELGCGGAEIDRVMFQEGLRGAPEVCRDVYVGAVRNYDPCLSSEECAGDFSVCGYPPPSLCMEACCVGSCRDLGSPPKVGEACTGDCEESAYCAVDPVTFAFTVCTAKAELGASCDGNVACADGLYCENDSGRCSQRRKSGESCDGAPCVLGLRCYELDGERLCRTLPDEGERCSSNEYPACARLDNFCDDADNRCARWPEPGEACVNGGCMPYADCDYSSSGQTCVARAGLGEGCGEIIRPNGDYSYLSCIGQLRCGESKTCEEPETPAACELPE